MSEVQAVRSLLLWLQQNGSAALDDPRASTAQSDNRLARPFVDQELHGLIGESDACDLLRVQHAMIYGSPSSQGGWFQPMFSARYDYTVTPATITVCVVMVADSAFAVSAWRFEQPHGNTGIHDDYHAQPIHHLDHLVPKHPVSEPPPVWPNLSQPSFRLALRKAGTVGLFVAALEAVYGFQVGLRLRTEVPDVAPYLAP